MGHDCGASETQTTFKNNVAHSAGGSAFGHGAFIYPDPAKPAHKSTCYEGSHFAAYKCKFQGVYAYYKSTHVIFSKMTMIDNRQGFGAMVSPVGSQYGV